MILGPQKANRIQISSWRMEDHGICFPWHPGWRHFQPAPTLPSGTSPWQCQHLTTWLVYVIKNHWYLIILVIIYGYNLYIISISNLLWLKRNVVYCGIFIWYTTIIWYSFLKSMTINSFTRTFWGSFHCNVRGTHPNGFRGKSWLSSGRYLWSPLATLKETSCSFLSVEPQLLEMRPGMEIPKFLLGNALFDEILHWLYALAFHFSSFTSIYIILHILHTIYTHHITSSQFTHLNS